MEERAERGWRTEVCAYRLFCMLAPFSLRKVWFSPLKRSFSNVAIEPELANDLSNLPKERNAMKPADMVGYLDRYTNKRWDHRRYNPGGGCFAPTLVKGPPGVFLFMN